MLRCGGVYGMAEPASRIVAKGVKRTILEHSKRAALLARAASNCNHMLRQLDRMRKGYGLLRL